MGTIAVDAAEIELADALECLTFSIGAECFGVNILSVQEIRTWEEVTRIPNAPEYVMGIFNLRGAIVPVYDLRLRLGMEFREYVKETVVIILGVEGSSGERSVGIVVDEVSDVFLIDRKDVKDAPDFGSRLNNEFIGGVTAAGTRMITLLHVDALQPPEQQVKVTTGPEYA
ncbi:MAG: chemotaxis protein CheW [Gammaproteobacteria bacterium]|nr:chemotaxis protein CheW [Gammaproteobacteria bacterium]